jgi:RNA polymerase II subunit A small phosphatase-like protein
MHNPSEENLSSKDCMPEVQLPSIIQQSDLSGKQITSKPAVTSWLSTLCNCFRAVNSNYNLHKDFPLLEPQSSSHKGKNTLILDLDETLIHSSFTEVDSDILLKIEVNNQKFNVYVLKRPGVDEFLQKCYKAFEVVVFTASLSNYADPLLDILDPNRQISFRLFRESCSYSNGAYVKDLTKLGRDLKNVVIVDVSDI